MCEACTALHVIETCNNLTSNQQSFSASKYLKMSVHIESFPFFFAPFLTFCQMIYYLKFQKVFCYFSCRYNPNNIGDDQSTNGLGKYTVWDGKYEDILLASRRFLQCKNGKNLKCPLLTVIQDYSFNSFSLG